MTNTCDDSTDEQRPQARARIAEQAPSVIARYEAIVDRFGAEPIVGTSPDITREVRDKYDHAPRDLRNLQEDAAGWGFSAASWWGRMQ